MAHFNFIYVLLLFLFAAAPCQSSAYPTCAVGVNLEGSIFSLVKLANSKTPCWRKIRPNETISQGDLYAQNGSYQFTAIVNFTHESTQYDHIFSVIIKELRDDGDDADPYIDILREKMRTLCRNSGGKQGTPQTWEEFSADFPGGKFNRFHSSRSVTRGKLANFHIAFLNARKQCVRTDDEKGGYRKTFLIDGVTFPDVAEFKIIAALIATFQSSSLNANDFQSKFKKFRVRLHQIKPSQTGMMSGTFFTSEGEKADVKIQSLSENRLGQNILPTPYRFQIR